MPDTYRDLKTIIAIVVFYILFLVPTFFFYLDDACTADSQSWACLYNISLGGHGGPSGFLLFCFGSLLASVLLGFSVLFRVLKNIRLLTALLLPVVSVICALYIQNHPAVVFESDSVSAHYVDKKGVCTTLTFYVRGNKTFHTSASDMTLRDCLKSYEDIAATWCQRLTRSSNIGTQVNFEFAENGETPKGQGYLLVGRCYVDSK